MLDIYTVRHGAFSFLTVFRVIDTKSDKLLADGTAVVGPAFARLGVHHNAFHFVTRWKVAVGVAALTRMHQRLNAALNRQTTALLWVSAR